MRNLIRIGTLNNALALSHANTVAALIKPSGYQTKIVTFDARDKHIGVLESALLQEEVDVVALHAGLMPVRLNDALDLIALTEREVVNDVLISRKKTTLASRNIRVGTNSWRRIAFLKHFYPAVNIAPVPEKISARIKKAETDEYALLMSHADAHRLNLVSWIVEQIETSYFVPAAGQGSIAIICHKKLSFDRKEIIQRWVNHEETEDCIRTERSFLKTIQDPRHIPVFAYAHFEGNLVTLKAGLVSPDGKRVIKAKRSSTVAGCKEMGKKVAEEVLQNGGAELLRILKIS